MKEQTLTYETAQLELEEILQELQKQAISVDELADKSKRAMELISFCKEKLRTVETELSQAFDADLEF